MREEPLNNEGWDRPVPSCGLYARYAVMFLVLEQLRWWETWGCMDNNSVRLDHEWAMVRGQSDVDSSVARGRVTAVGRDSMLSQDGPKTRGWWSPSKGPRAANAVPQYVAEYAQMCKQCDVLQERLEYMTVESRLGEGMKRRTENRTVLASARPGSGAGNESSSGDRPGGTARVGVLAGEPRLLASSCWIRRKITND